MEEYERHLHSAEQGSTRELWPLKLPGPDSTLKKNMSDMSFSPANFKYDDQCFLSGGKKNKQMLIF